MVYVLHAEMGGIEMSEWIKYDGSDKQIEEILRSKNGFSCIRDTGDKDIKVYLPPLTKTYLICLLIDCEQYLINDPHPYSDLIKIWADTGCPVWVRPRKPYEFKISDYLNHSTTRLRVDGKGVYLITATPDWNIPGAEYRLTPFED